MIIITLGRYVIVVIEKNITKRIIKSIVKYKFGVSLVKSLYCE